MGLIDFHSPHALMPQGFGRGTGEVF